MKALKLICTTAILSLSLAVSVAAGELTTPGYTAPPPPPPPPESIMTVDQSTPSVTITDQDPLIDLNIANDILWVLASIF